MEFSPCTKKVLLTPIKECVHSIPYNYHAKKLARFNVHVFCALPYHLKECLNFMLPLKKLIAKVELMRSKEVYAHSIPHCPQDLWQSLHDHLKGVSQLAGDFASCFDSEAWAQLLGQLHDIGKSSADFQQRLCGSPHKVDHSTAGVQYLHQQWSTNPSGKADLVGAMLARLAGYALAGHHGGLPNAGATALDSGTLTARLNKHIPSYTTAMDIPSPPPLPPALLANIRKDELPFALAFWVRMLFSCLVDADFLDTERFCSPETAFLRQIPPSLSELNTRLHRELVSKGFLVEAPITLDALHVSCGCAERKAPIILSRKAILQWCLDAAEQDKGFFSLTVPTGGGKTLSSLAFALKHAVTHGQKRIILVVPYTSIIEQNAQEFRDVLGTDVVLEHHCSYVHPDLEDTSDTESEAAKAYRLSTENWDASVIVTTAVQFFESLFAKGVSTCRKLHNISNAVVILDEAQMLPLHLLSPTVAALKELVRVYGVSVVLCSATQPALSKAAYFPLGLTHVREIVPAQALSPLFHLYNRVRVSRHGAMPLADLAQHLTSQKQVLCIVNARRRAYDLFTLLDDGANVFHLSSLMTPAHRTLVLHTIRKRLMAGQTCRLISTSLVECGVNISFPCVWREETGLDAIAQAAGRCNRHGEFSEGHVHVFQAEEGFSRMQADLQRRAAVFRRCEHHANLFAPESVQHYFSELYAEAFAAHLLDEKNILALHSSTEARFPFADIAHSYRIIDNNMAPVIIESEESAQWLQPLRHATHVPVTALRNLQRHTVSVYAHELRQLMEDGRVTLLNERFYVLSGGMGYHTSTGLCVRMDEAFRPTDFIF